MPLSPPRAAHSRQLESRYSFHLTGLIEGLFNFGLGLIVDNDARQFISSIQVSSGTSSTKHPCREKRGCQAVLPGDAEEGAPRTVAELQR